MTLKEIERRLRLYAQLAALGIAHEDCVALRRISTTLRRWHELECGSDHGAIEREEQWAIERAAWPASDRVRWWDGSKWVRRAGRRTYGSKEEAGALPPDGAFRDTGCKPFWRNAHTDVLWSTSDRERGAQRRLGKIMARYPGFTAYVQGDPRGCALYLLAPGDVPEGASVDSCYNRGVAVY